ncbi:MAG TPA: hypothetical protein VMJ10_21410 [Kofleriaceae bacterium]|nr:hypothetical protein [Kofleriaceae bacterium]
MRQVAIAIVLLLGSPAYEQPGLTVTIHGRVEAVMNGKPAKPPDGGLWVYVVDKDRSHKRSAKTALKTKTIAQRTIKQVPTYDPHVLVVAKGTEIDFPNNDSEDHNVFSPDPFFDLNRYGPGKSKTRKFDTPMEQEIYCDIHKCMWARVKVVDVLDDTYIQQVQPDGTYSFELPPGTYEVYAWAVASSDVATGTPQVLAAGHTWNVPELHVQLGQLDLNHKNKTGQNYPPSSLYNGCP